MADIFEPSGMAESFPEPIHQPVPDDISVEEPVNPIFDMMKEGESTLVKEHPPENPGQMPILLENHTPEIRYIVGSQLKAGDLIFPTKDLKEPEQNDSQIKDISSMETSGDGEVTGASDEIITIEPPQSDEPLVEPEAHTQIEDEKRKSVEKDTSHTGHA